MNPTSENSVDDINERKYILAQIHKQRLDTQPVPPKSPRFAGGNIYSGRYKGVVLKSSAKISENVSTRQSPRPRKRSSNEDECFEVEDIGLRSLLHQRIMSTNLPMEQQKSQTRRIIPPNTDDLPLPAPPRLSTDQSERSRPQSNGRCYGSDDEDEKKGSFKLMTVDDALEYLEQHRDCQYLHVTSRRSLEVGSRATFYDIVILERPGFPSSGLVWSKTTGKRSKVLKDRLMQLSLSGLLYTDEQGASVHIPLCDFLQEREMTRRLLQKKFFRFFYEKKILFHWKEWVLKVRFARLKRHLESRILLADPPIRAALLKLRHDAYTIESEIDIFFYCQPGAVNVQSYLQKQIDKIDECAGQLVETVKAMGDFVKLTYDEVISYPYLQSRIETIIAHHPLSKGLEASLEKGRENVDWTQVRGVQRLHSEYLGRITRVLVVGQYMIDNAMVKIMQNFWIRLSQLTSGVDRITMAPHTQLATWDPAMIEDRSACDMSKYDKLKRRAVADASPFHFLSSKGGASGSASAEEISGQMGNTFLSQQHQSEGCYLAVDVALVLLGEDSAEEVVVNQVTNSWSLSQVKVMSLPGKKALMETLHQLYGALGKLLDDMPNLREHELVPFDAVIGRQKVDMSEDEVAKLEIGNKTSAIYFSNLKISNILASTQLFSIAVRCMHQVRNSFFQSIDMDVSFQHLNETFHSVWSLNAELLAKQLDRSSLIVKMKEVIDDNYALTDDVEVALQRDRARISLLVRSIEQLQLTKKLGETFRDIRVTSGMITSFKNILAQIDAARLYQMQRLFQKLPLTFATRCKLFSTCTTRLKVFYLDERTDLSSLVMLLQKLKNFDLAKELLESEVDICETIYRLVKSYWEEGEEGQRGADESANAVSGLFTVPVMMGRRSSFDMSRGASTARQLTSLNHTHREHLRERDELHEAVGRSRMFALNHLKKMSVDILRVMARLHSDIQELLNRVSAADASKMAAAEQTANEKDKQRDDENQDDDDDSSISFHSHEELSIVSGVKLSGTHSTLREIGTAISVLRKKVNDNISAQQLLHDGHLIVGAAECALEVKDMDNFTDMDNLEEFYKSKYQTCSAILEANSTLHRLATVKLGTCDVLTVYNTYRNTLRTISDLNSRADGAGSTGLLKQLLIALQPMLELTAYLKCDSIKSRHWVEFDKKIFAPCNFSLTVDHSNASIDSVVISDCMASAGAIIGSPSKSGAVTGQIIGKIRSMPIAAMIDRGVGQQMKYLKTISAEACMERMIEQMLDEAFEVMSTCSACLSSDWMSDKFITDKLFFQLHRVTNCNQLSIILQYCLRAVVVAEHTAVDMGIELFHDRVDYMKLMLHDMLQFVKNVDQIQIKWLSLFHYVKYAAQGELDRDTERTFQSTSEDLKRVEILLQTGGAKSLFAAVNSARELNLSLLGTVQKLDDIADDIHSSTQSMLDACPRLTMLPYHRTKKLLKYWLTSPYHHLAYVNACLSEMFPGVGALDVVDNPLQKQQMCLGFTSSDFKEKIVFGETVLLNDPIEEFVKKFECQLRMVLSRSCDMIIVGHIQLLKDMTGDLGIDTVIECIRDVFRLRLSPLLKPSESLETDEKPIQSVVLVNNALFAEHVWFALGFPVGCVLIARPDLTSYKTKMSELWRASVRHLIDECTDNVTSIYDVLQSDQSSQEVKSLFSTLFQLEISFINTLDELLLCPCLESAIELWAGKYQLRFLYDKTERVKNSPFEVTLGCVGIPYGLEYQGGTVSAISGHRIETALQKVVGSACSFKGTVFLSRDDENVSLEAIGEYAVNCKDVASALGRVYTTLSTVKNDKGIKLFLSRLIYLEAVGCIDFTNLDMAGLHTVLSTLYDLWTAVEKKDDFFMVGTLKYPLKTRQGATTTQMNRRKTNMIGLRQNLSSHRRDSVGFFIVGVASETLYSDVAVLDYFSKSAFNVYAVENSRPIEDLGLLLAMSGFKYGSLLQMIFQEVIKCLHDKFKYQDNISFLSSSLLIRTIVRQCKAGLVAGKLGLHILNGSVMSDQELLRLEMECLYSVALEQVVLLGQCSKQELGEVHHDLRRVMQDHVNMLLDESCRFQLAESSRLTNLVIPQLTRGIVERSMTSLGYLPGGMFVEQCATLWSAITGSTNPIVIVSGPIGCGKSSVINCILDGIKREGFQTASDHSNLSALKHWRAAIVLSRAILKWLNARSRSPRRQASSLDFNAMLKTMRVSNCTVRTSYIHHSSLPAEYMLGSFDEQGRWRDGILLRKLRLTDQTREKKDSRENVEVIILQGPIGSNIEQVLAGPFYASHTAVLPVEMDPCFVNFPSGETCKIDPSVSIIMETSDLSNASPAMLMHTPHVHCGVTPQHAATRLLTTWIKSFGSWVRQFHSWMDTYADMSAILLRTGFVKDMISCDLLTSEMSQSTYMCRISSFLRYLEELLFEVHNLAISESSWQTDSPSSRSVVDGDDASLGGTSLAEHSSCTMDPSVDNLFPTLNIKEKDRLNMRMRMSIAYATVWGFGGGVNGTDRRQFFDVLAKQCFEMYLGPSVPFTHDNSVYEICVDLKNCCFVQAMNFHEQSRHPAEVQNQLPSEVAPSNLHDNTKAGHVDAVLKVHVNDLTPGKVPEIVFHTPSTRAFQAAFELLVRTGANVLVTGDRAAGKSVAVQDILASFGKNCPSPRSMRNDIMAKLLDIVCDGAIPDGIPAVLRMIRQVLASLTEVSPEHDDKSSESEVWRHIHEKVREFQNVRTPRQHCQKRTMFSTSVSAGSISTASEFRRWLVKELRSETAAILEPPRETYAVVFIEDLHLLDSSVNSKPASSRDNENNLECLVKGLIANTPSFAFARSLVENDAAVAGLDMPLRCGFAPILHKEFHSEPHLIHRMEEEDYLVTQLGMVATATGDVKLLQAKPSIAMLLPYACVVGYPAMSTLELKTAFVFGAVEAVTVGGPALGCEVFLLKHVRELADITLGAISHVLKSETQYTDLERSVIVPCRPTLSLIQRMCGPLYMAARLVVKPGDLLNVWSHEWKRNVLDPLPAGGLKSRLVWAWKGRLNRIDLMAWGISAEKLQSVADSVDSCSDEVWISSDLLYGGDEGLSGVGSVPPVSEEGEDDINETRLGSYLPLSMDSEAFREWRLSGLVSTVANQGHGQLSEASTQQQAGHVPTPRPGSSSPHSSPFVFEKMSEPMKEAAEYVTINVLANPGNCDMRSLFFGEAMSLVLRLVRILSITRRNVFMMGNIGNSSQIGIHLAATMCGMKIMSFDCKGACADVETFPNVDTLVSHDFKRFLKLSILTACGFKRVDRNFTANYRGYTEQEATRSVKAAEYETFPPQRVLMVISSSQLLSLSDKQQLLNTICHDNPCEIFDEAELSGLVESARRLAMEDKIIYSRKLKLQRLVSHTVADENRRVISALNDMVTTEDVDDLQLDTQLPTNTADTITKGEINYSELKFEILSRKGSSAAKSASIQGYTFQWLKKQLAASVATNLRVVMCSDVTRTMEYHVVSSAQRTMELAEKFDKRIEQNDAQVQRGMRVNSMGARTRSLRRFSMLSKAALYKQAHGVLHNKKPSERKRFLSTLADSDEAKSTAEYRDEMACTVYERDRNLYNCPILGAMLASSFDSLWWDIHREEATAGICQTMLVPTVLTVNEYSGRDLLELMLPFRISACGETPRDSRINFDMIFKRKNFLPVLSELESLGIFYSFSSGVSLFDQNSEKFIYRRPRSLMAKRNSVIAQTERKGRHESTEAFADGTGLFVESMLMEAERVLASLLTIPLPCDKLLFGQPVLCMEPEKCATTACAITRTFLDSGVRMLLARKQRLSDALAIESDALIVLQSLASVLELLEATQRETLIGIRNASSKLYDMGGGGGSNMEDSQSDEHHCQSEILLMQQEDMMSSDFVVNLQHFAFEKNVSNWRGHVKGIQTRDWVEFGKMFANKYCPKHYVTTMHCLMGLTGYMTIDKEGKSLLDHNAVIKLAQNSLRSMDFIGAIVALNPAALTTNQVRYLRVVNKTLAGDPDGIEAGLDTMGSESIEESSSLMDTSLSSASHISSTSEVQSLTQQRLAQHLRRLEELHDIHQANSALKQRVLEKGLHMQELEKEIERSRNSHADRLQRLYREREDTLHKLDAELMSTKEKILRVNNLLHDESSVLYDSVRENSEYLKAEIAQLDRILENLVADVCIAAALLVRAGWLPEQLRAECMDAMRDFVRDKTKSACSADPYVLGCLLDRLQVRNWTRYTHEHIDRDVPSINSMSLLNLSPMYTYIIDPEGSAEVKISGLYGEEYDCYRCAGSKFSLDDLESSVTKARSSDGSSIAIIVSDLQAGVSADLIAFLSADIDIYDPLSQEGGGFSSRGSRSGELRCVLNPSYYHTAYSSRSIQLLSKVRVVLISAQPPTIDNDGIGRPLSPQCYKNVTVVHWVSSLPSNFCVDSKPLHTCMNKDHAATCVLESSIALACLDKISPTLLPKLNLVNARIIDYTLELYIAESTALSAVLEWSKFHVSNSADRAKELKEYISHPPVDLSFLDNDECCRALIDSRTKRSYMARAVFNAMKLERDSLAYTKVFYDACWMSAEFIRFCGRIIPQGVFPPYALNAVTIAAKCIKPFIHNSRSKNFVRTIPSTFHDLYRTVKAIRQLQVKFRSRFSGKGHASRSNFLPEMVSHFSGGVVDKPQNRRFTSSKSRARKSMAGILPNKQQFQLADIKFSDFVHVSMAERDALMADLNVIIRSFHKKLLSSVYQYINSVVQPGTEWMVKLCLVLCTWAQTSPLPAEELRALMLLHDKKAVSRTLYSISYASIPSKSVLKLSAEEIASIDEASNARQRRGYNSRAMSVLKIAPRVETFWMQESTQDTPTHGRERSCSAHALNMPHLQVQSWLGRGSGPLDGQWINRRSQRWRVGYLHSSQEVKRNKMGMVEASPFHSWDPTFCDMENSTLVSNSLIFAPKPRSFDTFLEEWMKLSGMRTRHDFSSRGSVTQSSGEARFASTVLQKLRMSNRQNSGVPQSSSHPQKKRTASVNAASRIRRALGSRGIRRQSTQMATTPLTPPIVEEDVGLENDTEKNKEELDEGYRKFSTAFKGPDIPTMQVQSRHTKFVARPSSATNKPTTPTTSKHGVNYYDETTSIYNLLVTDSAVCHFKLLESHSAFSGVFKGMSVGISQYMEAFLQWKALLEDLCHEEIARATDAELVHLTAELIPPQVEVVDTANETRRDSAVGVWASGKELSVLQTMLLVSVVAPTACEAVAEVFFALCNSYLRKNNVILRHKDEYWTAAENSSESDGDDEDEYEDDESCSDEDDWNDKDVSFDTIMEEEEEEEEGEDDDAVEEENRKGDSDGAEEVNDAGWEQCGDDRFQDGIFDLNCWTKLKRIAGGTDVGRQVRLSKLHLPGRVRYRDFQPWEVVLADVLPRPIIVDKLTIVRHLRNCFDGCGPLFLATDNSWKQMSSLSHYAANYASSMTMSNVHLTIINCRTSWPRAVCPNDISALVRPIDGLKKKRERIASMSLSTSVSPTDSAVRMAVAVEMVDLNSGNGNSILDAAIKRIPFDLHVPVEVAAASVSTRRMSTMDSSGFELVARRSHLPAAVISAEWDFLNLHKEKYLGNAQTRSWGLGPMMYLGLVHSHWLPKHTLADVVGCSGDCEGVTGFNKGQLLSQRLIPSVSLSRIMSEGMLREALETSVLFVMRSMRRVARTRLSKNIQERIRYSSKVEISCTVCCILIWRMTLMLQAKAREHADKPGGWSTCLESLSLWQIARLVLKVSDIISLTEIDAVVKTRFGDVESKDANEVSAYIRQCPVFSRAIHLLAESFCKISFTSDNAGLSRTTSNVYEGQPMSSRTARSRLSVLMRADSGNGVSTDDFMSHYKVARANSPKKVQMSLRASSPTKSAEPYRPMPTSESNMQQPRRPIKEKPSVMRRRRREQAQQQAEASASSTYMSFDSLSSLSLYALGPNRRHYVSDELRGRLCATLGHYISGVISVRMTHQGYVPAPKAGCGGQTASTSESASPVGTPAMSHFAKKQSEFKDYGERWPKIQSQHCNLTVGTLSSNDVVDVLMAWTYRDALNAKASSRLHTQFAHGAERRKSKLVFNKIRKSLLLKAGEVNVVKPKRQNVHKG